MTDLPPVADRRPDRYYGAVARGLIVVGRTTYRAGDTIPCIGVRFAGTQGRRIEIPPEEIARVGVDTTEDHRAAREGAKRVPRPAADPARYETKPDPRAPHLVWVHDRESGRGGAERSNAELIRVGRDLGWRITHIHRGNVEAMPVDADAYLVAQTHAFTDVQLDAIDRAVYARGAPVITREHDYGFCWRRGAAECVQGRPCARSCSGQGWRDRRARYARRLERAALAVWISEAQRDLHAREMGRLWRREHLLPPPVDPDAMRPVEGVEREDRLAVCTTGVLDERKGRSNVARWADEHQDWRVELYVRGGRDEQVKHGLLPANVTVHEAVEHDELRRVYSRAALCLFLPTIPEPAGRTPVEAALCGARVEVNGHWSAGCFGLPLDDAEATRAAIRAARFDFWREVEGVLG